MYSALLLNYPTLCDTIALTAEYLRVADMGPDNCLRVENGSQVTLFGT